MIDLPELPTEAFSKPDASRDDLFYEQPRFVTHIDAEAVAAVTGLYRDFLPPGGTILDLMSSWVSHLPEDIPYAAVIGHGMNAEELAANPRLSRWFVQDLNLEPALPLADHSLDGAAVCVSVQYLQHPVAVFRELARTLRPRAPVVVTFSNRCFPAKAVAIWNALDGEGQAALVALYLNRAGFAEVASGAPVPAGGGGDPLWAVVGRAPEPALEV
jgi:SAM-dependent methyltransferase